MKPTLQQKQKAALQDLLRAAGITRIICVDDRHGVAVQVGDKVGWTLDPTNAEAAQFLLKDSGLVWGSPDFADDLRDLLTDNPTDAISVKLKDLVEQSRGENDFKALRELDELLQGFDYRKLLPDQWNEQKQALIVEAADGGTMLIFDQQLGDAESLVAAGAALILEAIQIAGDNAERIIFALLSYRIPEDSEQEWMEAQGFAFENIAVTPISKSAIIKPENLGRRLKIALLRPGCRDLQRIVIGALKEAHDEVENDFRRLYELAFDQVVLAVSEGEGAYEPEVVIRLFEALLRNRARHKLRTSAELAKTLPKLRSRSQKLREADLLWQDPQISLTTRRLQRMERYDGGDFVNRCMLPIDIGDVFQDKSNPPRKFILVAPQCDLMVRSSGRRKAQEATLLEIDSIKPSETETLERMKIELKFFDAEAGTSLWVDLRRAYAVRLWVLDLCAFNLNGESKINISAPVPDGHTSSWAKCYRYVRDHEAKSVLADLKGLRAVHRLIENQEFNARTPADKKAKGTLKRIVDRAQSQYACATHARLFPVTFRGCILKYGLKRVDRLASEFAYDVYRAYSDYQIRTVEEAIMGS